MLQLEPHLGAGAAGGTSAEGIPISKGFVATVVVLLGLVVGFGIGGVEAKRYQRAPRRRVRPSLAGSGTDDEPARAYLNPRRVPSGVPSQRVKIRDLALDRDGAYGAYAAVMRGAGTETPGPIHVVRDPATGVMTVEDGYHRVMERLLKGETDIAAVISPGREKICMLNWQSAPDWTNPVDVYRNPENPVSAKPILRRALVRRGIDPSA